MTVHSGGGMSLEYYPCRYNDSRILFRGPRRKLDRDYIAFLGGTETYGRFIEEPFAVLLERRLSMACANFGAVNAGIDMYLNDPAVLDLSGKATAKVVQVMGAQNMSNRFYSVHPRRNDRFLRASERLEALFPEVDFTDFHFNRHMLGQLAEISQDRYAQIVEELQTAWVARMKQVLTLLRGRVVLLWFSDRPPPPGRATDMQSDPLFVTRGMIETMRPRVMDVVEIVPSEAATMEGTKGMCFSEFDACAAAELPNPRAHEEVADALETCLSRFLPDRT